VFGVPKAATGAYDYWSLLLSTAPIFKEQRIVSELVKLAVGREGEVYYRNYPSC